MPQHQNLVSWVPTNKIWGVGLVCYMMLVPQGAKCCQMAIFVFGANCPLCPMHTTATMEQALPNALKTFLGVLQATLWQF